MSKNNSEWVAQLKQPKFVNGNRLTVKSASVTAESDKLCLHS